MATTPLVTVQEFLQILEPEGRKLELIGGEVASMRRGEIPHEAVKKNLSRRPRPARILHTSFRHLRRHL